MVWNFLLGKENRKILVLTAYNVLEETPAGNDRLYAQKTSLYLLDKEVNPNPRKLFIGYLFKVIKIVTSNNQSIILMEYFLNQ